MIYPIGACCYLDNKDTFICRHCGHKNPMPAPDSRYYRVECHWCGAGPEADFPCSPMWRAHFNREPDTPASPEAILGVVKAKRDPQHGLARIDQALATLSGRVAYQDNRLRELERPKGKEAKAKRKGPVEL